MSRRKYRPIDVDMLLETMRYRQMHDAPMAVQAMNYNGMGLMIASSRRCDDGKIVNGTLWMPGATAVDIGHIHAAYEGFIEPLWPEPAHSSLH